MSIVSDQNPSPPLYNKPELSSELLDAPPTPKSFGDAPKLPGGSNVVSDADSDVESSVESSLSEPAAADDLLDADSPIIAHFDDQGSQHNLSPTTVETHVPFAPLPPRSSCSSASGGFAHESRPASSSSAALGSPGAAGHSTPAFRYSSIRSRDGGRKSAASSLRSKSRNSVASPSLSPMQPEMVAMIEQVSLHRQDVAALAESTGILGDKYFECLRGYTSIQEPTNAFWKRRYFVVADKTVFMYINECSRTPTDFLPIESVVAPPRDAEDEVLLPHSIAVDFGTGEYFMYFDSAAMREAFEGEIRSALAAAS
ncbi:hypothetical protein GGI04_001819 [Coemansia thaxteri]|nr:hypothetical protein GGI04_001819 [Coemansia thaxteri]KAJ2472062.1 hypothetical protein GGI02_001851 [Coemansia sp. RSA 2322]